MKKESIDTRRTVSVTINGKRHYFKAVSRPQAIAKRDAFLAENKREILKNNILLKEWMGTWYDIVSLKIQDITLEAYKAVIETHIVPEYGDREIDSLNHIEIRQFLRDKLSSGLSVNMVNKIYTYFKAILRQAVIDDLLSKNPMDKLSKFRAKSVNRKPVITMEQFKSLVGACCDEQLKAILQVDMATGLRRGEILGLRWQDIDYNNNLLSVSQTIVRIKNTVAISSFTKKPASRRTISIDQNTVALLKNQRISQLKRRCVNSKYVDHGLVFSDDSGYPINPDNITHKIKCASIKSDMPKYFGFHCIRHTHATMLLQAGINIKVIQERLGHSSISTTLNVYAHVTPLSASGAAEKIAELMR